MSKRRSPILLPSAPVGFARLGVQRGGIYTPLTPWQRNTHLYEWATIVGKLLTTGDSRYKIGGLYILFQNVADPEDEVTPPTISRDDGLSYFNGLSESPDTDYIRAPLTAATLDSTDEDLYPGGNRQNYFALTTATEGVHGKPFSLASNSKVFGGAVAAFVDPDDPSQDLIHSRFNYEVEQQKLAPAVGMLGVEWQIVLD